jgi:hypothetical protein
MPFYRAQIVSKYRMIRFIVPIVFIRQGQLDQARIIHQLSKRRDFGSDTMVNICIDTLLAD